MVLRGMSHQESGKTATGLGSEIGIQTGIEDGGLAVAVEIVTGNPGIESPTRNRDGLIEDKDPDRGKDLEITGEDHARRASSDEGPASNLTTHTEIAATRHMDGTGTGLGKDPETEITTDKNTMMYSRDWQA